MTVPTAELEAMKRNPNRYAKDHAGVSDMSCPVCRETFVITGLTEEARQLALVEWPGCCIPNPSATAVGDTAAEGTNFGDPRIPLPAVLLVVGLFVFIAWVLGTALGELVATVLT